MPVQTAPAASVPHTAPRRTSGPGRTARQCRALHSTAMLSRRLARIEVHVTAIPRRGDHRGLSNGIEFAGAGTGLLGLRLGVLGRLAIWRGGLEDSTSPGPIWKRRTAQQIHHAS